MKKLAVFAIFASVISVAMAEEQNQMPPMGENRGGPGGGMMEMFKNLTDDQKTCLNQYDCAKTALEKAEKFKEMKDSGEKPKGEKIAEFIDKKEKMNTEEDKTKREEQRQCIEKAFTDCGIELPKMPTEDKMIKKIKNVVRR